MNVHCTKRKEKKNKIKLPKNMIMIRTLPINHKLYIFILGLFMVSGYVSLLLLDLTHNSENVFFRTQNTLEIQPY